MQKLAKEQEKEKRLLDKEEKKRQREEAKRKREETKLEKEYEKSKKRLLQDSVKSMKPGECVKVCTLMTNHIKCALAKLVRVQFGWC